MNPAVSGNTTLPHHSKTSMKRKQNKSKIVEDSSILGITGMEKQEEKLVLVSAPETGALTVVSGRVSWAQICGVQPLPEPI